MRGHTKTRATVAAGVMAAVLGSIGVAWACTPQASFTTIAPQSGPEGTTVTATGQGFRPGPVEIRWGSHTGPVIGMATAEIAGEDTIFLTTVTIPEAAPGRHALVAIARSPGAYYAGVIAFEVTAPAPEARDPKPSVPVDTPPPDSGPTEAGPTSPVPNDAVPAEPVAGEGPSPDLGPEPGPAPRPAVTPEPPSAAPSARQAVISRPAPVADRSTALPAAAGPPPASPAASTDPTPQAQVSGDLWSGFASGPDASPAASLVDAGEASNHSPSGLAIGIVVLVAGLVALVVAAGAAVMTRRRARAGSSV